MKNINTLFSEFGITVPEDKRAAFDKEFNQNYKTIVEHTKLQEKCATLETSLTDVQGKLAAFGDKSAEEIQQQIKTLQTDLENEKKARKSDADAAAAKQRVDGFLADKHFVNAITRDHIASKLADSLNSDDAKGKSMDDLFNALVTDKDGNDLPDILAPDPATAARFSKPKAPNGAAAKPSEAEYLAAKYGKNPFFKQ